jgi:predicted kinase
VTLFDCIEFDPAMRWIDVMSDVGFVVMDLRDAALADEFRTYLSLAEAETSGEHRGIVITHGVTGSGKTTRAQQIVESVGAIRVRSDVERKRLSGLDATARTDAPVGGGIYSRESGRQTYERLASLAGDVVAAGYPVVVDAAFLERWQRDLLRRTAADLHVPFAIADCAVPEPVLRERVSRRLMDGRDPSDATIAVLERQLAMAEPLAADER